MSCRLLHIVLVIAFLASGFSAQAQDTRKQESRKASLKKEINEINAQLKANSSKRSNEMHNLKLLDRKIATRNALVAENESEISMLSDSIRVTSSAIASLSARLDTLEMRYRKMVHTAYKSRDRRTWFMFLVGSRDLSQGIQSFFFSIWPKS